MNLEAMNLVVQAPSIATQDLKQLAKLAGAAQIQAVNQQAFKLLGADPASASAVSAHAAAAGLDWGFVPAGRRLRDFKLVALDMDSTLIAVECLDELAVLAGVGPEVAALTEAAMRGEVGFEESFDRRLACLAGVDAGLLDRVFEERVRLSPGAERLVRLLRQNGVKVLLVTGGFATFATRLQARLGLDFVAANTPEVVAGRLTGRLTGEVLGAEGKRAALLATAARLGVTPAQTAAVGDGANDLAMLAAAGVGIAYRAKPVVRERATYRLDHAGLDGVLALLGL